MYGPSLETPPFVQSLDLQDIDLHAVELLESKPVSLEQVELEILLSMKIEDGQSFEKAVQATMVCSGNEFLFTFPSDRFPIPCSEVACVRLNQSSDPDGACMYLYQEAPGESIQIADPAMLDEDFEHFAHSFISVMEQMRDIFTVQNAH